VVGDDTGNDRRASARQLEDLGQEVVRQRKRDQWIDAESQHHVTG